MASDFDVQLKEEAKKFVEPDEEILASVVAQARGTTTARAGGNLGARMVGDVWAGKSHGGAEKAGLELTSPMALALSQKRLLVFGIETSALGKPKGVKSLHSSAPLEEVQSVSVKRLLVGKTMKVELTSGEVKLEIGAGQDAKGFAQQFERVKATG
jgi:hypothetical protein